MRKKLLLVTTVLLGLWLSAFSQVTPKLLFTEFATTPDWSSRYFELTNMEDTILDLRDFATSHMGWWLNYTTQRPTPNYHLAFADILDESNAYLDPGASFAISVTYEGVNDDGMPLHRVELNERSSLLIYMPETNNLDLAPGEDSITFAYNWMRAGIEGKLLFYKPSANDSILVDAINNYINPTTNKVFPGDPFDVAGITNAGDTHVLVRKANVTQGSLTIYEWATSAGNDPSESQWMVVPYDQGNAMNPAVFTSVGNHGVYDIVMSSETLTIDETAGTITVPWGIRKGSWDVANNRSQGIFDEITWGEGMAWNYEEHGDSAVSSCQTGDTLNVYAFGNELVHKAYRIIAAEATASNALALPMRVYDDEVYSSWLHGADDGTTDLVDRRMFQPYEITEEVPGMDTIMNLPYAVRTDSLLAYIEIPPDATTEFIFVDEQARVDLKDGDILRITAGNGSSTKDYYLATNDIAKGTNAFLSAITWPDISEDMGWNGDTIPGFSPTIFSYTVTVPWGTASVPALSYFKEAINSKIQVDRATTLNGSREDMTTTITVSSQDTTASEKVVNVYTVTFEVEKPSEWIQPYHATPIISEVLYRHRGQNTMIEIANVGNQPINLANYMIVLNDVAGTPAEAIARYGTSDTTNWRKRYIKYIPGYKQGTWEEWQVSPAVMSPDNNVNPILEPGGTFVLGRHTTDPNFFLNEFDQVDIHWSSTLENANGEVGFTWNETTTWRQHLQALFLFEVLNPAVRDGSKPATDPLDFELVDMVGDFANTSWRPAGFADPTNNNSYKKKASGWRPNLLQNGGFADNPEDSDWIQRRVFRDGVSFDQLSDDIGNYSHDPITIYLSIVSSTAYIVDGGYEGDLNIAGVVTGSTVEEVFGNIIRPDTGQVLSVLSATTGLALDSSDVVTNGDTLMVVSADAENMTKYVLEVAEGGLDDNAVLTATEGSGLTISYEGSTGTIEGIAMDIPIEDLLALVIKPELAVLNVIDGDNKLIPLKSLNPDTVLVPTLVMDGMYFEVVAQNQEDIITYELVLDISASDAWVSSMVYTVDQNELIISLIPEGITVATFLDNLIPSGNATMELLTRDEFTRDSGYVVLDDILRVTSEDQSKSADYLLWILGGTAPERELSSEAHVTSETYTVNEDQLTVSDIPANTGVDVLLANLVPALGAEMELVDASDNPKTEGTVESTDKLVVTAEDGVTSVIYTLDVLVSSRELLMESIGLYPNPANNVLYLSGVPAGSTIELTTITGQKVEVFKSVSETLEMPVQELNSGYYIISVTDRYQTTAQFRFIKQ